MDNDNDADIDYSDDNDTDSDHRLYIVCKNLRSMLIARKMPVPENDKLFGSETEFLSRLVPPETGTGKDSTGTKDQKQQRENYLTDIVWGNTNVIFIPTVIENNKETVRDAKEFLVKTGLFTSTAPNTKKYIVVTKFPLKKQTLNTINERLTMFLNSIEFWSYDQLLIDPTKHQFCPKHEILSKEEVEKLTKEIYLFNLPVLLLNDKMSKWIGARVGDVVKITRNNFWAETTVNTSMYYRQVK